MAEAKSSNYLLLNTIPPFNFEGKRMLKYLVEEEKEARTKLGQKF